MSLNTEIDETEIDAQRRVLLVPPTRKDGEVTCDLLTKAGLKCVICRSLRDLIDEIHAGAAVVVLTDEALAADGMQELIGTLREQPAWSDLPVVILIKSGVAAAPNPILRDLRNMTLLERPTPARAVVSAVQAAARARARQYQIRDQIESIARAEARSRALQEQLTLAVNASELGIFHCEMPLGKVFWNDRCKAHFWLGPKAEVDLDLFYSLLHPDDREHTRQAVEACVYEGNNYDVEYRSISPHGEVRWIRATGRTYYDSSKQPVRFDGTTQDITQRKLVEAALKSNHDQRLESERAARQQAERLNRMKDEFLATLSHELRTPLNAIFGWTQILRTAKGSAELMAEGLTVIDRNVRMQTQLIEDLLDMSRIASGKVRLNVQPVDLPEVVNAAIETVRPTADAKEIRLEKVVDQMAGPVSGDPDRLQQVLWNLLTNAIKFTPRGGRVHVLVEQVNSHIEISVTDTGQGVSAEFLPHLFERFSQADASITRKHRGLGLGLSIVKSLVELHGGTIRATSPGEGQGATFIVRLPRRVSKHHHEEVSHPKKSLSAPAISIDLPKLRGLKVLVIDDEADARELVKRFLLEYDAIPASASSAVEARLLLSTFDPDIILSDIGMPGEDGYEFMKSLRIQGIKTPAVALTAFARAEDRIHSIQAGYQSHLPKPVEPAELLAVIAGLAGRYDTADEA